MFKVLNVLLQDHHKSPGLIPKCFHNPFARVASREKTPTTVYLHAVGTYSCPISLFVCSAVFVQKVLIVNIVNHKQSAMNYQAVPFTLGAAGILAYAVRITAWRCAERGRNWERLLAQLWSVLALSWVCMRQYCVWVAWHNFKYI